jgi:hypothetical protein
VSAATIACGLAGLPGAPQVGALAGDAGSFALVDATLGRDPATLFRHHGGEVPDGHLACEVVGVGGQLPEPAGQLTSGRAGRGGRRAAGGDGLVVGPPPAVGDAYEREPSATRTSESRRRWSVRALRFVSAANVENR